MKSLAAAVCAIITFASAADAQFYTFNNNNRSGNGTVNTMPSGSALGSMYGNSSVSQYGTTFGGGGTPSPFINGWSGYRNVTQPYFGSPYGQPLGMPMPSGRYSYNAYPVVPAPLSIGGGYYQLNGLNVGVPYWRSPGGYYYPWAAMMGTTIVPTQVVYVFDQGAFSEAKPSVTQVISDMRRFLEDAKSKGRIDDSAFESIYERLNGIQGRAAELSARNNGLLDTSDDAAIRRELDGVITDITRQLSP